MSFPLPRLILWLAESKIKFVAVNVVAPKVNPPIVPEVAVIVPDTARVVPFQYREFVAFPIRNLQILSVSKPNLYPASVLVKLVLIEKIVPPSCERLEFKGQSVI